VKPYYKSRKPHAAQEIWGRRTEATQTELSKPTPFLSHYERDISKSIKDNLSYQHLI
jgi:hypothetical protein